MSTMVGSPAFRRAAPGHRYLHLATHGYFAPPELRSALGQTRIIGVATNLEFQGTLLSEPEFAAGGVDTGFVEHVLARAGPGQES